MVYNPYLQVSDSDKRWIKANFHAHAGVCEKGNCGELPMQEVVEAYGKAKYDVLAISNHNMFLEHPDKIAGVKVLDAIEYSKHPHMLQIGVKEYRDVPHQEAINDTVEQGGFIILCHPNWNHKEYWDWSQIDAINGYMGIEIFNPVIYTLKGSGLALDTWDYLLSQGKRVWGFGNDDFHQWRDIERAYNVIYSKSTSFEDIREAISAGNFYVSNGVALKEFSFDGKMLLLKAGLFTETYVNNYEFRFIGQGGRVLQTSYGETTEYYMNGSEKYLRVEVTAEHGAKMFLQPITFF